ncbi:DNA kinase/phosphatase Pnk1 [Sporothrix epigloea]|uniref:DNA kinase/phosphatase Pnk1 n=1 Tax=Sporothrix epigloea TaxID=1892477 RepID=A0ABP0DR97_9PEZI
MPLSSNATPPAVTPTLVTDSDQDQLLHSPTLVAKRKADSNAHDPAISPPPTKRKVLSSVSKSVVASFFTPASQKPAVKSSVAWDERAPAVGVPATLLVATFCPEGSRETSSSSTTPKRRKVAAFDLDSTLITTASGKKHAVSATDWTWWDATVPQRLRTLYDNGFAVIIFSNQGGLVLHPEADSKKEKGKAPSKPKAGVQDRVASYKQKCAAVLTELGLPTTLYAATGKDRFRKPRPGMWQEMIKDLGLSGEGHEHHPGLDLAGSFFVGDAAGRVAHVRNGKLVPKDFSCSDRNLAANVGVRFETPEEYFLGEAPREFARGFDLAEYPFVGTAVPAAAPAPIFTKGDGQELVVFCGPPGAGKSTFARLHMEPLGFERVNQDTLKSKDRCIKRAAALLQSGKSVVIDNTNPDPGSRALWMGLGKKQNVLVRCVWFKMSPAICEHNEAVRSQNKSLNPDNREPLPRIAFNSYFSRFQEPKASEGFSDIIEVAFTFSGTEEDYALWGTYWL